MFVEAWNTKGYTSKLTITTDAYGYLINNDVSARNLIVDGFYVKNNTYYWLASPGGGDNYCGNYEVGRLGSTDIYIGGNSYGTAYVYPVVCLKASTPATTGTITDFSLIK